MSEAVSNEMAMIEAVSNELNAMIEIFQNLKYKNDHIKNELSVYFHAELKLNDFNDVIVTHDQNSFKISYFPPVYLQLTFREEAPFHRLLLDCCWLSGELISKLEQKISTFLSEESESILWNIFQFLENDLLMFLFGHTQGNLTIDIKELSGSAPDSYEELYEILNDFNTRQLKSVFDSSIITCSSCLVPKRGRDCVEIKSCGHIFCVECASEYFDVQIKNGVLELHCLSCGVPLHYEEVKSVLSQEAFERWDQLALHQCLRQEQACKACPRCATLVMTVQEDDYGICSRCRFPFCVRCSKTYHGPGNCPADVQTRIRRAESELDQSVKKCPGCKEGYDKVGGCNKMTCSNCGLFFCFLCHQILDPAWPYQHFGLRPKCYL